MCFNLEQFGTLLGRFFGVFVRDLEQFGTADLRFGTANCPRSVVGDKTITLVEACNFVLRLVKLSA
jgi:hypothetical protein